MLPWAATMELHDESLADACEAVRRELVLPFSREEAWPVLAEPAELETWFADEVAVEIAEGARGTVRVDGAEREVVVDEVATGRRVAFRWRDPDRPGDESLVELTLDDVADGTRLTVLEVPVRALPAVPAAPAVGPTLLAAA